MAKIPCFILFTLLTLVSHGITASGQTPSPRLPPPTGPNTVGTVEVQLTDSARTDPFAPGPTTPRTFMVQIFYPTWKTNPEDFPIHAPYMPATAAALHERSSGFPYGSLSSLQTNSHRKAPIQLQNNTAKVILFSPGFPVSRAFYTCLAEELASQGFVVVAIDHTYEAEAVEFPDGTVAISAFLNTMDPTRQAELGKMFQIFDARTHDAYFVIDTILEQLAQIPGANKNITIGGIGMYGHSLGGATAAEVALSDDRVLGGLNMDGEFMGNVVTQGLDKPFFLMSFNGSNNPTWPTVWGNLRGWKRHVQLLGGAHMTYSDIPALHKLFGTAALLPPGALDALYGTIDGIRAVVVERAYVVSFFNFLLKGIASNRTDTPGPEFPEIVFPSEI